MSLLLDTHVFLWWRENSPRLREPTRRAIARADDVWISAASAWEIAIKTRIGKIRAPASIEQGVEESGFRRLLIDFAHAAGIADLPLHHRDPFDRMLIAQARVEGLTIVTHDRRFEPYGVGILWI